MSTFLSELDYLINKECNSKIIDVFVQLLDRIEKYQFISTREKLDYYVSLKLYLHRVKKRFYDNDQGDLEEYKKFLSFKENLTQLIKQARNDYYRSLNK